MRKLLILIGLLVSLTSIGQTEPDSISMKKVFGGYQFYKNDKKLNMKQLAITMEPNKEAYTLIKSARSTYRMASAVSFAGGFIMGWQLGAVITGNAPNWTMLGVGAGLVVVTIPMNKKFNQQAKQAVDVYNLGHATSFWDKTDLHLSMSGTGLGLTMKF